MVLQPIWCSEANAVALHSRFAVFFFPGTELKPSWAVSMFKKKALNIVVFTYNQASTGCAVRDPTNTKVLTFLCDLFFIFLTYLSSLLFAKVLRTDRLFGKIPRRPFLFTLQRELLRRKHWSDCLFIPTSLSTMFLSRDKFNIKCNIWQNKIASCCSCRARQDLSYALLCFCSAK